MRRPGRLRISGDTLNKEIQVRRITVPRLAALALTALVLGACTAANADSPGGDAENLPTVDQFQAGACRSAAEDVQGLAKLAKRANGAKTVASKDRAELRDRQVRLAKLRADADPGVRQPLSNLVTAIGFVRVTPNTAEFDPKVLGDMDKARRALQKACVK
jgi:hypothetical protein